MKILIRRLNENGYESALLDLENNNIITSLKSVSFPEEVFNRYEKQPIKGSSLSDALGNQFSDVHSLINILNTLKTFEYVDYGVRHASPAEDIYIKCDDKVTLVYLPILKNEPIPVNIEQLTALKSILYLAK